MKQKQQTKNKHSGPSSRSDQWTMDMQNRLKSTLEGKISRIETFIESANEETDSVDIKVKLRSLIQLQKNVEELRSNYYAIPNVKDAELTAVDEDLHLLEVRLESLESSGVKSQDLGGQFTGPKREIRRSPNLSFNKSIGALELCDMLRRLVGTTAPGHHDCSIQE
ncbi:uncharacterized protein TNCV_1274741 [Trichonephila clavipes]|nr:uncharacterized protein TNCV_1274741 [Trichonephila clavipes]